MKLEAQIVAQNGTVIYHHAFVVAKEGDIPAGVKVVTHLFRLNHPGQPLGADDHGGGFWLRLVGPLP